MKALKELKQEFRNGTYRPLLTELYADESRIDAQIDRYIHAIEEFERIYGSHAVEIYSAPGRSEIG